uniref:Putative secreted protein n=1 Tax=Ixodes ricinus TaxID=34613 RepID=A0A6B0TTY4_IXORI
MLWPFSTSQTMILVFVNSAKTIATVAHLTTANASYQGVIITSNIVANLSTFGTSTMFRLLIETCHSWRDK